MNGLGGLNKSPNGVVVGVVQLQLPVVVTPVDLAAQTQKIVATVGKARRNMATTDLVVFPEYSLHGLSMDMNQTIMCSLDGPEIAAFKQACRDNRIWGCFSIMEFNPHGNPYNSGVIIDDTGELKLYYRKMHPWTPVEPWEPGDIGIPVGDGPKGAKLALIICHDGMFPEMARECAYKGAEIMIRTAGGIPPIRAAWRFTNQANSFQNLMATANVCMCGSDGDFDLMGEGMLVNFDGSILAEGTTGRPRRDHHRGVEARPRSRGAQALGGREQHLSARPPRHDPQSRAAPATAPTPSCRTSWPAAIACLGRTRLSTRMEPLTAFRNLLAATATNCREPRSRRMPTFEADPYPWPYNGDWRPDNTAIIVIDMQTDFCGKGGYVDLHGLRPVPDAGPDRADQGAARSSAGEGLRAARRRHGGGGDRAGRILVRGEPGWDIIDELKPLAGEPIIDKPGKGSFCATDLELDDVHARHRQSRAHRDHHRRLRAHHDARSERSRLRVPAARGLLRRDRLRQSSRGAQDGQDAGRRVRRRRRIEGLY